jgi:DNA ligase-1
MNATRRLALQLAALATFLPSHESRATDKAPALLLAKVYKPGIDLDNYWVSEKFDGLRGYWDGQHLWTRGGEAITPPDWFTARWPSVPMDGELWAGHGRFAAALSTVRQRVPQDQAWRAMRYQVFDLPAEPGPFTQRLQTLTRLLASADSPLQLVEHVQVASPIALEERLRKTVKAGGEGLMLHRGDSAYKGQRSDDLLKYKTHDDADARVVAHIPGQGRLQGKLGALLVEAMADPGQPGQPPLRFKIGTGLTDAQRQSPPPLGTWLTYRFRGLNDSGLPRFASFVRLRDALEGPPETEWQLRR